MREEKIKGKEEICMCEWEDDRRRERWRRGCVKI